jgi:hypothetical protein
MNRSAGIGDLELLRTYARMVLDERGRIAGQWGVTIAASSEGQLLLLGSELPEHVVARLQEAIDASSKPADPSVAPAAVSECERLLDQAGELSRASGPLYVMPAGTRSSSIAELTLSTDDRLEAVRGSNPGNWLADEWADLVEGKLGPWAMAAIDGRVISICVPRSASPRGSNCVQSARPGASRRHASRQPTNVIP